MVNMDLCVSELGFAPDEPCALGGVQSQPSEMEKIEFEADIWAAFSQLFLTYEEAIQAINDFNLGIRK